METPYWCTVLVHQYGRRKSIKHLEFTFSMTALSFHSRTSIRAHKHISNAWNGYTAENQEERLFFNEIAFLCWCHALWKLGSSNCCSFEMKHATGRNGNLYKKRYLGAKTLFYTKFLRPYGPVCVLAKIVTLRPWRFSLYIKVYQGWALQRSGSTDPPKENGRKFAPTAPIASKFRLGNTR